jgi:formyltetrahydrofolate deformylase
VQRFILTLSCPDRKGIVAAVANFLLTRDCNIVESAQSSDEGKGLFFMRLYFAAPQSQTVSDLRAGFGAVAEAFSMHWAIHDCAVKARVIIMVSKFGHCLNDLLYRFRIGALPVEIPAIVSNHRDFYQLAAANNIPFHYMPVNAENRQRQEEQLLQLLREERCDLLVLARYMQILSSALCSQLKERAINIHHSFLPSFQGAKPYHQAYDRGVKLIGATAHYVTEDLDEGPIIEQDVARVDHNMSAEDCAAVGRDVESAVLARAVKWQVERRILLNGNRTVVFA